MHHDGDQVCCEVMANLEFYLTDVNGRHEAAADGGAEPEMDDEDRREYDMLKSQNNNNGSGGSDGARRSNDAALCAQMMSSYSSTSDVHCANVLSALLQTTCADVDIIATTALSRSSSSASMTTTTTAMTMMMIPGRLLLNAAELLDRCVSAIGNHYALWLSVLESRRCAAFSTTLIQLSDAISASLCSLGGSLLDAVSLAKQPISSSSTPPSGVSGDTVVVRLLSALLRRGNSSSSRSSSNRDGDADGDSVQLDGGVTLESAAATKSAFFTLFSTVCYTLVPLLKCSATSSLAATTSVDQVLLCAQQL